MSIADKLTQLDDIRSSMRTKLVAKGVDASAHNFADFPDDVESIPSRGGWESFFTLTRNNEEIEFEFVPLINFDRMMKTQAGITGLKMCTTGSYWPNFPNGTSVGFSVLPFFNGTVSSATSTSNKNNLLPIALSDASLPFTTQLLTSVSKVGTTTFTNTMRNTGSSLTSTGWTSTINVTANSADTIRHFIFLRKLIDASYTERECILFALKLKNPVELNAGDTATFTLDYNVNYQEE